MKMLVDVHEVFENMVALLSSGLGKDIESTLASLEIALYAAATPEDRIPLHEYGDSIKAHLEGQLVRHGSSALCARSVNRMGDLIP